MARRIAYHTASRLRMTRAEFAANGSSSNAPASRVVGSGTAVVLEELTIRTGVEVSTKSPQIFPLTLPEK